MRPSHNDSAIWLVIFVFLVFLVGSFVFIQYEILQIKNYITSSQKSVSPPTNVPQSFVSPSPSALPSSSPTASPTPTPLASPRVVSTNAPSPTRITYIPLTGGSSQSTSWVDIAGSNFTLNIGDYGKNAYATWDANVRVDNANGTTFVRLFDKTHSIAVNGSEISIANTSTSTDVTSGSLSFWQGNNSYVVQIKSLNGYTAFMDSGRIKINY